jgi:hypothetical protein
MEIGFICVAFISLECDNCDEGRLGNRKEGSNG